MHSVFIKLIYYIYPPILRILEKLGAHKKRQNFLLGILNPGYSYRDLEIFLKNQKFEHTILTWKHIRETIFEPRNIFFDKLLGKFLKKIELA